VHGDPSESRTKVGEIEMGPGATMDYYGLILAWHDRWLKGIRNGIDEGAPVRIFVMGENVWREENEWPLARARPTDYFFRGAGQANTAAGDGRLSTEAPAAEPEDHYTYDPGRPVVIQNFETPGPFDHAPLQARRDMLVYTTPPLESELEVTGPITVHLWAASSAVDTDFAVTLCDVYPDGKAYNLTPLESGYLRARYRNSESRPEMLTPGAPTEFTIGGMVTSNLFRAGHRIRIQVTSSRFPSFDRNPNTGQRPERAVGGVAARQTIYHDSGHPSRVVLPIVPR